MLKNSNKNSNIVINHLLVNGIINFNIINAFLNTNKDAFLPPLLNGLSCCDGLIFFTKDRFMLENSTLLFLFQIADLKETDNVLILGADLGFSIALLSSLVNSVTCIEEDQDIISQTNANLLQVGINNYTIINDKLNNFSFNPNSFNTIIINGAFYLPFNNYLSFLNGKKSIVGIHRKNNLSQVVKITKQYDQVQWNYYKHCNSPYLKGLDPMHFIYEI